METTIIVVCVVVAALLLAAIVYKAVLLSKQIKHDRLAAEADDAKLQYLEIVQSGKVIRIEGEDVVPAKPAQKK